MRRMIWVAGVMLLVLAAAGLVLRRGEPGLPVNLPSVRYQPAAETPRIALNYMMVPGVQHVRDFDGDSAHLYLLDPMSSSVHVVVRDSAGWHRTHGFGRRGGGPGEFVMPTGIALLRDTPQVVVAESGRLHFFALDGTYLRSSAPRVCGMLKPRVTAAGTGLYLHGRCTYGDSVAEALFWTADREEYRLVTFDVVSRTKELATIYGASNGLGEGSAGEHVFAAGVDGCLTHIAEGTPPTAAEHCDAAFEWYRFELQPDVRRRMEERRSRSTVLAGMRLPTRHPAFLHAFVTASGPILLRSWDEDSIVVRREGSAVDLAVLPLGGLVGCRRAGCLYADAAMDGMRLAFLDAERLAR